MSIQTDFVTIIIALLLLAPIISLTNRIRKFRYRTKRRNSYISKTIDEIDYLKGKEFEEYLEALFHKVGYKSQLTKGSHDFGADLVMKSDRKKIIIQAKRYKGTVGVKAVMEVYAAMAYYKADEGYVFTNSTYTKNAVELAEATGVILCDKNDIIRIRERIK